MPKARIPTPTDVLLNAADRAKRKVAFDRQPTDIAGVSLQTEPEIEVDMPDEVVRPLASKVGQYVDLMATMGLLKGQAEKLGDELKQAPRDYPGFRGVLLHSKNLKVSIFPSYELAFEERGALRRSLGDHYPSIVRETFAARIDMSRLHTKDGKPLSARKLEIGLRQLLAGLGVAEADIERGLATDVELEVNQKKLTEALGANDVKLSRRAATVKAEKWAIKPDLIEKPQKPKKSRAAKPQTTRG